MRDLRILLVVNAFASSVTARNTVVVHRELSQRHEVEIVETNRRGHATRFAQDAARRGLDVVIGFGVLTAQQAQVRRRELVDTLTDNAAVQQMGVTRTQIEELVAGLEARLSKLDERFAALEGKLDTAIEATVERLPEQAGALVEQAHEIAKVARKQVRGMLRTAA